MRRVRILLLETLVPCRHLDSLERVLRSSPWPFEIERRRWAGPDAEVPLAGFGERDTSLPDVVYLEVGDDNSWWLGAGLAGQEMPVFAVSETIDPEEIFGLLSLGFTEVLPPPLTAITVLPRLWQRLGTRHRPAEISVLGKVAEVPFRDAKKQVVRGFEKTYLTEMLARHRGNITQAARAAQKDRRAFWELMRKHQIDVRQFQSGSVGQGS